MVGSSASGQGILVCLSTGSLAEKVLAQCVLALLQEGHSFWQEQHKKTQIATKEKHLTGHLFAKNKDKLEKG